jgi:hypothetical protein
MNNSEWRYIEGVALITWAYAHLRFQYRMKSGNFLVYEAGQKKSALLDWRIAGSQQLKRLIRDIFMAKTIERNE